MIFDADQFADLIAEKVAARLEQSLGDEVLTLDQAAELLQFHPNTIRQQAQAGKLPGSHIAGAWRFRRSALLAHITDTARMGVRQSLALAGD